MCTYRILLLEDDPDLGPLTRRVLEMDGHEVVLVGHGDAALAAVLTRRFDLVLTDIEHPGASTRGACRLLRDVQPAVPVIVQSGFLPGPACASCEAYLSKPWRIPALLGLVRGLLARRFDGGPIPGAARPGAAP